jgi:hypothetical protein
MSFGMKIGALSVTLILAATAAAVVLVTGVASASQSACGSGANGSNGYAYAGNQATAHAHGIRARITVAREPRVDNGQVAGWVGVGGAGEGPNGENSWLQTGVVVLPNTLPILYAEIAEPGRELEFVQLETDLVVGETRRLAVLEMAKRPNYWRVWVNGQPVTRPIFLPESGDKWQPIATAESWNGGTDVCNSFGFRFEQVGVAGARGGSWHEFTPGYEFLDRGYALRPLTAGDADRIVAAASPTPYAFEAFSR